ncbi:MAG: uroporphyrinogen decarboxylase family protein [Planctomycetota bacterium]
MDSSRKIVEKAVRFEKPARVPRDLWVLPWAEARYGRELEALQREFPRDFAPADVHPKRPACMKGDIYAKGDYVDAWGCRFFSLEDGLVGEVREPLVATWSDLDHVRPPYEMWEGAFDHLDDSCAKTDRFVTARTGGLFERMQDIRTMEQLLVDLIEGPRELLVLRDRVHEYNLFLVEKLAKTAVDALTINEDWGTQSALLIPPAIWREVFKPLYRDYIEIAHKADKLFFMHSDGCIMEIYEDLIDIGVDAVNSQLFCMDIEEIARRFKGRICFWGEIDRQQVLPAQDTREVTRAVERVVDALYDPSGGVIAQCEFGLAARPENVREVYAAWQCLTDASPSKGE